MLATTDRYRHARLEEVFIRVGQRMAACIGIHFDVA
jgi:hypothetical protein